MSAPARWTDESNAMLRDMWARGMSCGEIAAELEVTRNSVIGRVHRMKLEGRPSPLGLKNVRRVKPKEPKEPVARKQHISSPVQFRKWTDEDKEQALHFVRLGYAIRDVARKTGVSRNTLSSWFSHWRAEGKLTREFRQGHNDDRLRTPGVRPRVRVIDAHLRSSGCQYPIEDRPDHFRFCCEPVTRGSYCSHHASLCYIQVDRPFDLAGVR